MVSIRIMAGEGVDNCGDPGRPRPQNRGRRGDTSTMDPVTVHHEGGERLPFIAVFRVYAVNGSEVGNCATTLHVKLS